MNRTAAIAVRVAAAFTKKRKVKNQDGEESVIYEYSDRHVQKRTREKVDRLNDLQKNLGKLRKQVRSDLDSDDEATRLTALCVALIDHTFERVGNTKSAEDGNHGVTTWQKKHLTVSNGKAVFRYVGKSDVEHEKPVTDKKLVDILRDLASGKGKNDYLFCKDGDDCHVAASKVNQYLEPYDITAKDLRGFHANRIMAEKLKKLRPGSDEKAKKDAFKKALEETAEDVGHEAATLKKHYLAPSLEADFMKDGKVDGKLRSSSTVDDYDRSLQARFRPELPPKVEITAGMYTGVFIPSMERQRLLRRFGQEHSELHTDHLTLWHAQNGGEPVMDLSLLGKLVPLKVVGYACDEKAQAIVIQPPTRLRPEGRTPHITISTAPGVSPAYSNTLLTHAWDDEEAQRGLPVIRGRVGWFDGADVRFDWPF